MVNELTNKCKGYGKQKLLENPFFSQEILDLKIVSTFWYILFPVLEIKSGLQDARKGPPLHSTSSPSLYPNCHKIQDRDEWLMHIH